MADNFLFELEAKKIIRRIRNNEAALRSRQKKLNEVLKLKQQVQELQNEKVNLEFKITELQQQVQELQDEKANLEFKIKFLEEENKNLKLSVCKLPIHDEYLSQFDNSSSIRYILD